MIHDPSSIGGNSEISHRASAPKFIEALLSSSKMNQLVTRSEPPTAKTQIISIDIRYSSGISQLWHRICSEETIPPAQILLLN